MSVGEIRVGEQYGNDGTYLEERASKNGALTSSNAQGFYYENTSRGRIFSMVLPAWTTTIAAGNINAAAAAASTQFALWNPVGSGVNLSILKFGVFPISGTAPVAGVFHSKGSAPTVASSAAFPVSCNLASNGNAATKAGYMSSAAGATLTGGGALTLIRAADLFITAGTAANLQGGKIVEQVDGDIVIPPGMMWVPTWTAAGTTFLGGYSITWEELPA